MQRSQPFHLDNCRGSGTRLLVHKTVVKYSVETESRQQFTANRFSLCDVLLVILLNDLGFSCQTSSHHFFADMDKSCCTTIGHTISEEEITKSVSYASMRPNLELLLNYFVLCIFILSSHGLRT